jgi:hypothetical protein
MKIPLSFCSLQAIEGEGNVKMFSMEKNSREMLREKTIFHKVKTHQTQSMMKRRR